MFDGVFEKEEKIYISERTFQRYIKKIANLCGVDEGLAKTHGLRHRFALNYLAANPYDITTLASLLGHQSLETTRQYLNVTSEVVKARMDKASRLVA